MENHVRGDHRPANRLNEVSVGEHYALFAAQREIAVDGSFRIANLYWRRGGAGRRGTSQKHNGSQGLKRAWKPLRQRNAHLLVSCTILTVPVLCHWGL